MDERELRKLAATVDYVQRVADTAANEVAILKAKRDQARAEADAYDARIAEAEQAAQAALDRLAAATQARDAAFAAAEAETADRPAPEHQAGAGGSAENATVVTESNDTAGS